MYKRQGKVRAGAAQLLGTSVHLLDEIQHAAAHIVGNDAGGVVSADDEHGVQHVSYTHIDVYKRQIPYRAHVHQRAVAHGDAFAKRYSTAHITVQHGVLLHVGDVYKRPLLYRGVLLEINMIYST